MTGRDFLHTHAFPSCFLHSESRWQQNQKKLLALVNHKYFTAFIVLCIVVNTIILALRTYDTPSIWREYLAIIHGVLLAIYTLEAVLKIAALGPSAYLSAYWNRLELLIVITGHLQFGFEGVEGAWVLTLSQLVKQSRTLFRHLTFINICLKHNSYLQLRPIRLGRVWPTFNSLLMRICNLVSIVLNHAIVLCLVIFIFVVFGTKYYGRAYVGKCI